MTLAPGQDDQAPKAHFRRRHRLTHAREFQRVFAARVSQQRGPLIIYAIPNGLAHPRLGLSIGRRVGNAVRRNRIKRLLREAFRGQQHEPEMARGYDLVITVRPHGKLELDQYSEMVRGCIRGIHKQWERRNRESPLAPGSPGGPSRERGRS